MSFSRVIFYLALCIVSSTATIVTTNTDDLIAVFQIFRHGQRNPVSWYTNDPWKNISLYELGAGQLTKGGKKMHYDLGKFTRGRYGKFLPRTYDPSWFRAQTTDVDRTHMSIQSNLAYIFKPTANETWNSKLPWQPIPIHPIETNILSSIPGCAIYQTEFANVLVNDELFKAFNDEYDSLYKYLTNYTGDNITSVATVYSVYDTLHIEDQLGFELPSWTNSVYPEPMRTISGYAFDAYSYTTEMKRLAAGSWLNVVYNNFVSIFNDPSSTQKFQMYSAHDMNIASILNTLGAFDPHYPAFASTLYFELRNKSGTPTVNIWHKDDDWGIFEAITIRNCTFDCSLSNFKTALSDYLIDTETWDEECAATSTPFTDSDKALTDEQVAQVLEHVKEIIACRSSDDY